MTRDLRSWSAVDTREAIRRGEVTCEAVCQAALDRCRARVALHAFEHLDTEGALARARALDAAGPSPAPLHGVPIALKDNISTAGVVTTAGSRILAGYRPAFDATVVRRLTDAGAVIIGKTVCDEFAMGSSTEHSASGPARNPWATDRTPGGSSGGSAVAVAAGLVPLALGSDTGGSIRQPAAFCGVLGLKPTYGRVSRYGLIAFASSLDQIGPFARQTGDLAVLLDVIAGPDPRDSTSAPGSACETTAALGGDIRGMRIGVPRALVGDGVDADVREAFDRALETLTALGADVVDVELPHSHLAVPVYYLVATAEASSNLARYDGVRYGHRHQAARSLAEMYDLTRSEGFGTEVKRRLMLGTYVLSAGYYDAYYRKAQQVRTLIRQDFDRALAEADAIAMPTTPTPAFRLGEHLDDPVSMYLADVFTVSAPLAGLPALSIPAGFSRHRLPVGLQLIGRAWDEATLMRLGDAVERATPWSSERPPG